MAEAPHRHNGGPLNDEDAEKLWGHIRALEVLEEQKAEISEDQKARKALCKSDGFDTNIVGAIIKRRKQGQGEAAAADQILRIYEQALDDQGALPLEQTKQPATKPRSSVEEVAQRLHGQEPPPDMLKDEEGNQVERQETGDAADYYERAVELVRAENKASTSWLQRHFAIGYNSAARLIERMEREGIVSAPDNIGRRTVLDPVEAALEALQHTLRASGATMTVETPNGAVATLGGPKPEKPEPLFD